MSILVINPGSSSVKIGLYESESWRALVTGQIDWAAGPERAALTLRRDGGAVERTTLRIAPGVGPAVRCVLQRLSVIGAGLAEVSGVGQRVVHGGARLSASVRVDPAVKAEIERLAELAPLHNPAAIEAMEAVAEELPDAPQVAIFDTAFYQSLAPARFIYPLPYAWYTEWGVRRFGFHGISHGDCAQRAAALLGDRLGDLRVVSCHLGNGCSATASRGGTAIATTMGFTPLDGLMMGTRPGSLDPGICAYVQRRRGLTIEQVDQALNHEAGLLGVSGVSSDYRLVESAAAAGDQRARLALDIYAVRVREAIGALAVTLGGVDALVFTGGVGEHAAPLRAAVCQGLECLGLHLDPAKNLAGAPDASDSADITGRAAGASTGGDQGGRAEDDRCGRILVLRAREELAMARETVRVLGAGGGDPG
jgi:acetate kinase